MSESAASTCARKPGSGDRRLVLPSIRESSFDVLARWAATVTRSP